MLAGALGLACGGAGGRPNLVLLTVDTLRPDRLACYGGAADVGTALCALGERGTRYAFAFSAAPSTAPSIASLLTSRYPSEHGVSQFAETALPRRGEGEAAGEIESVAELLRDAGYETAAFVSNPVLARSRRLDRGFAIYDDAMPRRERNRPLPERSAEEVTDAALAWLRVTRRPFFLWVHYQDPHGPYAPPEEPQVRDRPGAEVLPTLRDHSGYRGIPGYQVLTGLRSPEAYAARYEAEIRYLDVHVARLLQTLEAESRATGVVLTADHGEAFGEDDYWFAHGHSVGLEQIHVPLLLRPPQPVTAGAVVGESVGTVDVAPTLLGWAGLPAPASFRGRPLPPGPDGEAGATRTLFAEHRARVAAIRGDVYLARDLEGLDAPRPDRITGGELHPLPERAARLGTPAVGPPPYRPPEEVPGAGELGPLLSAHAESAPRPEADPAPVDPDARERLRELGYLE